MSDGSRTSASWPTRGPSATLAAGTVVGDYVIERKLGHGGMGAVYQAIQPIIGKPVALKVIHYELCENADAVNRFVVEARAVNRVRHPNIVDVFGFGTASDGRAFLAMELLDGTSLCARLDHGSRLKLREACDILIEVTHALEAAHGVGVVHRDLKPDNIFLLAEPKAGIQIKLLDFGIAKLQPQGGMHAPVDCTQPGTLVGTPEYMAPEQARGDRIDGRADIYSLGVVAFEMLAGRTPFHCENSVELIAKHITLKPPTPSAFNPALPPIADELIGAMLAKDPAQRPTLAEVREGVELLAHAPPPGPRAQHGLEATAILGGLDARRNRHWHRWWLVPALLVVVAAGVKIIGHVLDDGNDAPPPIVMPSSASPAVVPPDPPPRVEPRPPVESSPAAVAPQDPPQYAEQPSKQVTTPKKRMPKRTQPNRTDIKSADSKRVPAEPSKPSPPAHDEDDDALRSPFDPK